ncbi:MAG: class II glutamine amidotransferase [marine bacterium B5-7]|nr:MAG: class II glutamine amidotransferase [marine bacterium B5-7]
MCRIATYIGPTIPLQNIITGPKHSLLSQSRDAVESKVNLNGDGFGIAWYGQLNEPGLYREILPAWSDENLKNLCRMMQSHLFIAHVRASTIGETMRVNCHPFTLGKWSFAHNGQIGGFPLMQREMESLLPDDLYLARRGTTDSEILFLMLIHEGLEQCPISACRRVIDVLESKRSERSISSPLRLTFVFSNGNKLFGVRYASDQFSPTLYRSKCLDNGGISLASEPLDGDAENWIMLNPSTMIEIDSTDFQIRDL